MVACLARSVLICRSPYLHANLKCYELFSGRLPRIACLSYFHRCARCRSPVVLCECVVCRCRGDLHVVCFKFSLIGILDACLRGIFVNGATFDCFWVIAAVWVNFLAG